MTYQIPAPKTQKWDVEYEGKHYLIPLIGDIPYKRIKAIGVMGEVDAEEAIDKLIADFAPSFYPVLDTLTTNQVQAFFTEWKQESGISVGESSASSPS